MGGGERKVFPQKVTKPRMCVKTAVHLVDGQSLKPILNDDFHPLCGHVSNRSWGGGDGESHQPSFLVPITPGLTLLSCLFSSSTLWVSEVSLTYVWPGRNILASLGACLFCMFMNIKASHLWPLSEGLNHIHALHCIRDKSGEFGEF